MLISRSVHWQKVLLNKQSSQQIFCSRLESKTRFVMSFAQWLYVFNTARYGGVGRAGATRSIASMLTRQNRVLNTLMPNSEIQRGDTLSA